ncbi:hypothetical protein BUALT_Bualt07G0128200 [Buddleja alternifolia]|uniref:PX domain-containing protein n=1 Tax=Buddleja alternifolia TaxID=168488 RepID=A0AAV6XKW2_9LAMI|nr:hypothetical protein BUALT_Bualt07G0128200 [Buddleja alternifolia]
MNLYGLDYSLFDVGFNDPSIMESLSSSQQMIIDRRQLEREEEDLLKLSNSILKEVKRNSSPPKHRHDGTSPLPLGMDWSPSPRNWDGPNTIWPHDFHTGWSYCVTVPSWSIFSESEGSEPIVFYRVQVGLQSPEGVTTIRGVLRRFSDFLKLSSDLKLAFRAKKLPLAPSKGLLRTKSRKLLEERNDSSQRRCALEDWMGKILSNMDFSRSAPVACFLELEAAARSSFSESSHPEPNVNLSCNSGSSSFSSHSDVCVVSGTSALGSNLGNSISGDDLAPLTEATTSEASSGYNNATLSQDVGEGNEEKYSHKLGDGKVNLDKTHIGDSNTVSRDNDRIENSSGMENSPMVSHVKYSESLEASSEALETLASSNLQFSMDKLVVLPTEKQQKMNKLLTTMQEKIDASKIDMEDLTARLNHELAVRDYLTTKVKDLETELKSTKTSGKENLEQAVLIERERFTQMQWDMEELRRKCMDMEAEKDQNAHAEATKTSIIQENEALRQELDSAREQLKNLQKFHEEANLKSKSDVKLLAKEVKSLRSSQSELRQELDRVAKERTEFETRLIKERTKREHMNAANAKLLHECEILRSRLDECSVNFLVEEENKLKLDAPSPSDALDILATSENRIGLLLAETQLLSQDVATRATNASHESEVTTTDNELKKMLTDVFIDNAILRKQAYSIIRCALRMMDTSDSSGTVKADAPS